MKKTNPLILAFIRKEISEETLRQGLKNAKKK
jgi:hypothetical protein